MDRLPIPNSSSSNTPWIRLTTLTRTLVKDHPTLHKTSSHFVQRNRDSQPHFCPSALVSTQSRLPKSLGDLHRHIVCGLISRDMGLLGSWVSVCAQQLNCVGTVHLSPHHRHRLYLADVYRDLFPFGVFNAVQSQCLDVVLQTENNLVRLFFAHDALTNQILVRLYLVCDPCWPLEQALLICRSANWQRQDGSL